MTNRKQTLKHYSKVAHKDRTGAIIATKKLQKRGILVKPYKRGNMWYVTERYRGDKVLRILEDLKK